MRQDGLHEIVEYPRFGRHGAAGIGVHVPGAQLVERRGLLVREVQQVAPPVARPAGAVEHLLEDVGQAPCPADGVVLRPGDREIHESLPSSESGAKSPPLSPSPQGRSMPRTELIATGFHVPQRIVTNDDLSRMMDTSDEWITQRSGIRTRYWVSDGETGVSLAREATCRALAQAGMQPADLDCIVYCTCTPDHFEPGNGVFLARELGLRDVPAIDVRNQCSGFVDGLSVADAWIRTGQYRRVLLVGAEVHSRGLDRTTRRRHTAGLFSRVARAAILPPHPRPRRGVLTTHLYADGRHAQKVWGDAPGLAHD